MKALSKLFYKITGWTAGNYLPDDVKKCVMVAAPHTTNWDFPYTLAYFFIKEVKIRYVIKKEWMDGPVGWLFRTTGGIGIDRASSSNFVDTQAELLKQADEMILILSPEGTRKTTGKWKTGFYYTALQANVPVALAYLDYKRKLASIDYVFHPTGDYIKDMEQVKEFYKSVTPKYPEKFTGQIY